MYYLYLQHIMGECYGIEYTAQVPRVRRSITHIRIQGPWVQGALVQMIYSLITETLKALAMCHYKVQPADL